MSVLARAIGKGARTSRVLAMAVERVARIRTGEEETAG